MTHACNTYNHALTAADSPATGDFSTLKKACEEARNAHDEALAGAWEMIEEHPSSPD
jgi:hypothetical protein